MPENNNTSQALISYFRLEIGDRLVFDQRQGQIIGTPYVSFNTGQHDLACITIDDPEDEFRSLINPEDDVEVFIGFNLDYELSILSGKISKFGRKLPDGLVIYIMDFSSENKSSIPQVIESKTGEKENEREDEESEVSSELEQYSDLNRAGEARVEVAKEVIEDKPRLNYQSKSKIVTDKQGEVILNSSDIGAAEQEALRVGDEIITQDKTTLRLSPDGGDHSGITIDWVKNRSVFIDSPTITKRTDNQSSGSGGTWQVQGWNADEKTTQGALIVVPPKNDYDRDREVDFAGTRVKLGDPIFPESLFLWGEATLGGKYLPTTEKMVERIVSIAKVLDKLNRQYAPNEKWQIVNWLDPKSKTRHATGDAIDFAVNDNLDRIYSDLDSTWEGGLALYPKRFIHIDNRQTDGLPKLRFEY